jgi:hypothetical protein
MSIVKIGILILVLLQPSRSYAVDSVCGTTKACEVLTGLAVTGITTVCFFLGLDGAFRFGSWFFDDSTNNQNSEPLPSKWDSLASEFYDFIGNPSVNNLDDKFKLTNDSDVKLAFDSIGEVARHNKKFLQLTKENVAHLSNEWKLVLEATRMQLNYEAAGGLDFSHTYELLSEEEYARVATSFPIMLADPQN